MSETPRIERFLEGAARAMSGAGLHPIEVLQRIQAAAEASVRDGAMANAYRVEFAPADGERVRRMQGQLERGAARMLDEVTRSGALRALGQWEFEFVEQPALAEGSVRVSAAFRDPSNRGSAAVVGATRVITRQRGKWLVLDDGQRVALTHTPFVIGRAQGCDLVIADLSISRRHAEICSGTGGELVLHDLGSRNGVQIGGERIAGEATLPPGVVFMLGEARFWLEVEA